MKLQLEGLANRRSMGVIKKLRELGAKDGDVVRIKELEFDFLD